MARRTRIKPHPTIRDFVWECRQIAATMYLDVVNVLNPQYEVDDYIRMNDLIVECLDDIENKGEMRPAWLDRLEELADELESEFGEQASTTSMDTVQLEAVRLVESATFDIPPDHTLLEALLDAGGNEHPVGATAIARLLWHGEHGHGDLCRLGKRLRELADVGDVVRHPGDGHRPNRWSIPVEAA